jgi:homoserine dehydrogenase
VQLALLGTGTVGSQFLSRLDALGQAGQGRPLRLVHVANSRGGWSRHEGLDPGVALRGLQSPGLARVGDVESSFDHCVPRIVIDATASDAVAARHARWLAAGVHVVTACKLGAGQSLARWRAIRDAGDIGGTQYGDSATVGAGLPVLRSIRGLRQGGDRIHAIAGVLSGSLAWLLAHYDASRPFSECIGAAKALGFTEPDPRQDLSGEDVRRKLLILSRCAGFELPAGDVRVEPLLPEGEHHFRSLDAPMRERYRAAVESGGRLHYVARLQDGRATAALECLPAGHALAGQAGSDNRVAIWSDRYADAPLLIQGPGAGAQVTAAALLDDVLRIVADGCVSGGWPTDLRHARGQS